MPSSSGFSMHSSEYTALNGLYFLGVTLHSSDLCKVKLAVHTLTGSKVAVKIVEKKLYDVDGMMRKEIAAMTELSHQSICQLYQVIETDEHFFVVMEYCSRGDLADFVIANGKLSEDNARIVFRQMVGAVAYMHSRGFAHLDLKPDNFLLDADFNVKLIDFGHATKPGGGLAEMLHKLNVGTAHYRSPEQVAGVGYRGAEVDVWCLGVCLYCLLVGLLPFDDDNVVELYGQIYEGKYQVPEWLSADSVLILKDLLQAQPQRRITISELLEHPWLMKNSGGLVSWKSQRMYRRDYIDEECVMQLSQHSGQSQSELKQKIAEWKYDYFTSSYLLLLRKKMQNRPPNLNKSLKGFPVGFVQPQQPMESPRSDTPTAAQTKDPKGFGSKSPVNNNDKKSENKTETPRSTQTSPDQPTHGTLPPTDALTTPSKETTAENKPQLPNPPHAPMDSHTNTHNALSGHHMDSQPNTHNAPGNADTNVFGQTTPVSPSGSVGSGGCKVPRAGTEGRYSPY